MLTQMCFKLTYDATWDMTVYHQLILFIQGKDVSQNQSVSCIQMMLHDTCCLMYLNSFLIHVLLILSLLYTHFVLLFPSNVRWQEFPVGNCNVYISLLVFSSCSQMLCFFHWLENKGKTIQTRVKSVQHIQKQIFLMYISPELVCIPHCITRMAPWVLLIFEVFF